MPLDLRGVCPLLQVFDMPASLAFYRDLLGFEIVSTAPPAEKVTNDSFGWVWLRHGQTQLMLNTAYDPDDTRPATRDPARVAAHDDTILYIGAPDVDAVHRHLLEHGLQVDAPKVTHYRMRQLMVKDPDGFSICFQWTADETDAGHSS
jgi:glyoxylase I family protein